MTCQFGRKPKNPAAQSPLVSHEVHYVGLDDHPIAVSGHIVFLRTRKSLGLSCQMLIICEPGCQTFWKKKEAQSGTTAKGVHGIQRQFEATRQR